MTSLEEIYRSVIDNSNEYIYRIVYHDDEIAEFFCNALSDEFFGCPSVTMDCSKTWLDYLHPDDESRIVRTLGNLRRRHGSFQVDHRIVSESGEVKWVSNFGRSFYNDMDASCIIYGYMQNVTGRNSSLRQLRTLSRAVEQSPASVLITDINGNIEYVNPKFTQLTGYTLPEVLGKNPRILKSGEMDISSYRNMWNTILAGNEWKGEFHNRKKNGDLYWELASISPVRDESGDIHGFLAVKEDITEIKEIENKLRQSQYQLRMQNEAYQRDLRYAQHIQRALLPLFPPSVDYLEIKYRFNPVAAIGGDYFSFFHIDDDMSVFIGDVAGHGVAAALFLALLKYITEMIGKMYFHYPSLYLGELNSILNMAMTDNFITAVYSHFRKTQNGVSMHYSNGGHPAILVYHKSSGEMNYVKAKGTILGMFPEMVYGETLVDLEKGDRVFMYTDGFPETRNKYNDIIGYENVDDVVMQSMSESLDRTLDNIINYIDEFTGSTPLDDDLLIIGFEIK